MNSEIDKSTCLINGIWSLPLTHCYFENFYSSRQCFLNIQVISNTMNYLAIDGLYCDFNVLYHLFNYTPALRHLSISCNCYADDEIVNQRTSSIHSLKLVFHGSINFLTTLFQHLPNLYSLIITMSDAYLNGTEWEKILLDYLPKVKKFRFRMNFPLSDDQKKDKQVDELLIKTFRTDFWIEQHQWLVQCDWDAFGWSKRVFLYTLPYDFNDFSYYDATQ